MSMAAMNQTSLPGIRDFPLADLPFLRFWLSFRNFGDSSADFEPDFRFFAGMIDERGEKRRAGRTSVRNCKKTGTPHRGITSNIFVMSHKRQKSKLAIEPAGWDLI